MACCSQCAAFQRPARGLRLPVELSSATPQSLLVSYTTLSTNLCWVRRKIDIGAVDAESSIAAAWPVQMRLTPKHSSEAYDAAWALPDESGAMLAAALSAVKETTRARAVAKILRAEQNHILRGCSGVRGGRWCAAAPAVARLSRDATNSQPVKPPPERIKANRRHTLSRPRGAGGAARTVVFYGPAAGRGACLQPPVAGARKRISGRAA